MTFADLDLSKSYTYGDYLTWQIADRIELIKGKIWKMAPAPSSGHQRINMRLSARLFNYFENNQGIGKSCEVYAAPFDVTFTKPQQDQKKANTVLQPDICVICDATKVDNRGCNGAPDLVVEVVSPGNSRHEMQRKFEVYEEFGVREYWLVEPSEERVIIYTLQEGKFVGHQPKFKEQAISSHIFPGFIIDLEKVF